MQKSVISTTAQCIATFLHIGWGYLLIIYLDWGVAGASLALNITYVTNYLIQELYIRTCGWSYFQKFM